MKVSKVGLTKAIGDFEKAIDQLNKNKDVATLTLSRKVRLAAGVMENLELMNLKMRKMSEAKDLTIEVILGIDDENLSKPKEEHINEIEMDHDKTIKGIQDLQSSSEDLIAKAEEFLQGPQITNNSVQPVSTAAAAGPVTKMFQPQSNLKPIFLDKMATHLEVVKFVQGAEVYVTGHLVIPVAFDACHLEQRPGEGRCEGQDVGGRRIDFLASKRGGRVTQIFSTYWKKN